MARARRRRGAKRRVSKDWVYTNDGYSPFVYSQNSGVATAFAMPLVYSNDAKRIAQYGPTAALPVAGAYMGGYANPDAQKQVVYAVDGHLVYNPSAWALGNEFIWGWRLVIKEMTSDDGGGLFDAGYSMWQNDADTHVASWRNDHQVLAEGRWYRAFGENTSNGMWVTRIRWSSRMGRRLNDNEGLYLWTEGASASVNTARNRIWCRTLMKRPA